MKSFKILSFFALIQFFILISCDKNENSEKVIESKVDVTEVSIISDKTEIFKGDSELLKVTILPINATNKDVYWKSSNEGIASVDNNGLVTGISVGEVSIYVVLSENELIYDEKKFQVKDNEVDESLFFITTWQTENTGVSEENQITIPTYIGETYDYNIFWGDGTMETNVTGDITHTYAEPGTYDVKISGIFPRIYFYHYDNAKDNEKLLLVKQWGTLKWFSMKDAFIGCKNLDVIATDIPDLSLVFSTVNMFNGCESLKGNSSFENWEMGTILSVGAMFAGNSVFNQDIGNWDVSNVNNMSAVFNNAYLFDQDIGNWDVSNVTNMQSMFDGAATFNQNIENWDVSNVTNMAVMFEQATKFNQPLGMWDVSKVEQMEYMFYEASTFNQDISSWDVSSVINMRSMFEKATTFNQSLIYWNVSNVNLMPGMFEAATSFNQDISLWNVEKVTDMSYLFKDATSFNQDIGNWNVINVENMYGLFKSANSFNQNIGSWNTSNVTNMELMFEGASVFNQYIGNWDVSNVTNMWNMFFGSALSKNNYDMILIGWNSLPFLQNDVIFTIDSAYCQGEVARQNIINTYSWNIQDGGKDCN